MDHGGHAINYVPVELLEHYRVIGIEKTAAGFFEQHKKGAYLFPVIDVANSLAKKYFESPLIAKAVVNKIFSQLPLPDSQYNYGVVGLGSIGYEIAQKLLEMGQKLILYDINPALLKPFSMNPSVTCTEDINTLLVAADWIFGCSGRDITKDNLDQFSFSKRNKVLLSCSSEDKEFLSLLHYIEQQKPRVFKPFDTVE